MSIRRLDTKGTLLFCRSTFYSMREPSSPLPRTIVCICGILDRSGQRSCTVSSFRKTGKNTNGRDFTFVVRTTHYYVPICRTRVYVLAYGQCVFAINSFRIRVTSNLRSGEQFYYSNVPYGFVGIRVFAFGGTACVLSLIFESDLIEFYIEGLHLILELTRIDLPAFVPETRCLPVYCFYYIFQF